MCTGRAMFLSDLSPASRNGRPSLPKIASRTGDEMQMPPGSARGLEPRRDIDPVAVGSGSVMDDVAEIDADPEQHPAVSGNVKIAFGHDLLNGDGALDRPHGARKLRYDPVACDIDD